MSIVCGLDVHRAQITYDHLDTETGEVEVGRIVPATRCGLKDWLSRFEGQDACCVCYRGCTGWRFVVEELRHAGVEAHLTEPADTATMRGRKASTVSCEQRLPGGCLSQRACKFRTLATLGLAAATGNALAMRVQRSLEPSGGPVNEWLLHQFHMVTGNHRNHGRTTCQTAQASAQ